MLHFYDIAFLFFHEYIHRVGVNKLKCMALEAEELQRRAYHRHRSVFLGPLEGAQVWALQQQALVYRQ